MNSKTLSQKKQNSIDTIKTKTAHRFTALAAICMVVSGTASAATQHWDGNVSTANSFSDNNSADPLDWLNGGNWDNGGTSAPLGSWTGGDTAIFGGTFAGTQTVTLSSQVFLGNGSTIGGAGSSYSISLTGTGYNQLGVPSGSFTIHAGSTLSADAAFNNAHNLGAITLIGGTLTSANGPAGPANDGTYGNWLVRGVTAGGASLSTISSTSLVIESGSFNVADAVAGSGTDLLVSSEIISGALTKNGAGTMELTGANTYTGPTIVNMGTLALVGGSQSSPISVSSGASLQFTLESPTISTSSFDLSAGTVKITGTPTLPSYTLITSSSGITGSPTLDAPISGYVLAVDGNSLKLVKPKYWDGSVSSANGASDNNSASAMNWLSGGNWDDGITSAPLATWSSGDVAIFGGSFAGTQTVTLSSPVLPGNGTTIGGAGSSYKISITGTGFNELGAPSGAITINADSTLSADAASNNAHNLGPITLNGGTLTSANGLAGPANDGGFGNWTVRSVTAGGSSLSTISTTTLHIDSGSFNVADAVAGSDTDLLVSSKINSGTLIKDGVGTMELTGANTYTGPTTVNMGTLALVGGSQSSPVTVGSGASLQFTLESPTTSTSSFDLAAGTVKIIGTPSLPSYTLITSSSGITGTPTLNAPISGYVLVVDGTSLKLVETIKYWDGSVSSANGASDNDSAAPLDWLSGGNWDNHITSAPLATWTSGEAAIFGGTFAGTQTVTLSSAVTLGNGTTMGGAGSSYTISLTGTGYNQLGPPTFGGTITIHAGSTLSADAAFNNAHNIEPITLNGGTLTSINGPAGPANDGGYGNWIIRGVTAGGASLSTISSTSLVIESGSFDVADAVAGTGTDLLVSSSIISEPLAFGALIKDGDGTMELTGANTYTTATAVNMGTLAFVGGSQSSPISVSSGASLQFTLGSPTTSTSSFDLTDGTVKIVGTPTLPSYTLITSSSGIAGTPTLDAPISGYALMVDGTSLKLVQGFDSWMAPFITGGLTGDTTPGGDPENDGMKNLLEYALNGNPSISDPSIQPDLVVTATDFEFTYSRLDLSLADTTQTFEYGSNLTGWTPVLIPAGPGVEIPVDAAKVTIIDTGTTDSVTISIPKSVSPSGKLFGRLKVVAP